VFRKACVPLLHRKRDPLQQQQMWWTSQGGCNPAWVALLMKHLEEEHWHPSPFTEKAVPCGHYQSDLLILLTTPLQTPFLPCPLASQIPTSRHSRPMMLSQIALTKLCLSAWSLSRLLYCNPTVKVWAGTISSFSVYHLAQQGLAHHVAIKELKQKK